MGGSQAGRCLGRELLLVAKLPVLLLSSARAVLLRLGDRGGERGAATHKWDG